MKAETKEKMSRFEFAIMEAIEPEKAKQFEPYTKSEEKEMRVQKLKEKASKLRLTNPE